MRNARAGYPRTHVMRVTCVHAYIVLIGVMRIVPRVDVTLALMLIVVMRDVRFDDRHLMCHRSTEPCDRVIRHLHADNLR